MAFIRNTYNVPRICLSWHVARVMSKRYFKFFFPIFFNNGCRNTEASINKPPI